MPISISYQPNANLIGQMAFQGGIGNYNQVQQQLKQQADLQNAARYDDRWALETQIANQQYLNSVNNNQALTQQARGFQNTNYGQQQSIADVQKRQQADIGNQQFMQGRSLEDAGKARALQSDLTQWTTQYGAWDAQTRQAQQIQAQMQQVEAQIKDAQQRAQWGIAADMMRQRESLGAQLASQQAQMQHQGQMAQFNAGQDMARLGAQGSIQSMLSDQSFRQNVGLQGMASQDQMALQQMRGMQQQDLTQMELVGRSDQMTQQFLMENMLGPFSGYADQISARQARIQDTALTQKISALDRAVQDGIIAPNSPAYQRARNELLSQRLGLQQSIGLNRSMQQAELEEQILEMPTPNGSKIPVIRLPNGTLQAVPDPSVAEARLAKRAAQELQTSAMSRALDLVKEDPKRNLGITYLQITALMGDPSARAELERMRSEQLAMPQAGSVPSNSTFWGLPVTGGTPVRQGI